MKKKAALRRNHISQFPDVEATFLENQLIFVYILSLYHYPPESEESARDYYNSYLKRYADTDLLKIMEGLVKGRVGHIQEMIRIRSDRRGLRRITHNNSLLIFKV